MASYGEQMQSYKVGSVPGAISCPSWSTKISWSPLYGSSHDWTHSRPWYSSARRRIISFPLRHELPFSHSHWPYNRWSCKGLIPFGNKQHISHKFWPFPLDTHMQRPQCIKSISIWLPCFEADASIEAHLMSMKLTPKDYSWEKGDD